MKRTTGTSVRRRSAVALNLALGLVVSGAVTYAVAADGFTTHRPDLNDGGIWVTDSHLSTFGRVNKPIGQIDSVVFTDPHSDVDIVQQDAAVVGVNASTRRLAALDPATATLVDGSQAELPRASQVQLNGGTLAVLDAAGGVVWATTVDPAIGRPDLSALDAQATPLASLGGPAALAVADDGTVVVVSSADDTVSTFAPSATGFAAPVTKPLAVPITGAPAVTVVGRTPVVLDADSGQLQVVGGPRAVTDAGAVLQQPGPDAPIALVATPTGLSALALDSGRVDVIAQVPTSAPAQPVRLGPCAFGAWAGGRGRVTVQCGSDPASTVTLNHHTSDLVFRINRGQILLNDRLSGGVWNIDDKPVQIDNWESFRNPQNKDDKSSQQHNNNDGDRRPPKARDDRFGVRPGRISVTHPLDNDSASVGRMLAVSSVEQVSGVAAPATISPDGQTIQVEAPGNAAGTARYEYYISDGRKDVTAHATMTVSSHAQGNAQPRLRHGFRPHAWAVAASGTLTLPVLPDWRDPADSDAIEVDSATVNGGAAVGGAVRTTTDGRLRFTAPNRPGPVKVTYAVSDGRSEPVQESVTFRVLDVTADPAVAPVAEPDIVSAESGEWVTIHPLANDLPGADPLAPDAELRLSGAVTGQGGAEVVTDVENGTISFRAKAAKTYFLDYDAAYGNAPLAAGKIRVDVHERERRGPVAMPDTATIYGPSSTAVDVLANDYDPRGGVLMVESAQSLSGRALASGLDVAVIDGRWVRVSARSGELRPRTQIVRYTISNGIKSAVGEIQVTQRPLPLDNSPVTEPDQVTVRAGASASIPVLDNDFSPSGDQLKLVGDLVGSASGQLDVLNPEGVATRNLGAAFVSGRLVRYVAPETLTRPTTITVPYVATNATGDTAQGTLQVSVVPAGARNRLPEAPILEGRVVAGDTVTLHLPGAGIDPDGDNVSLLGLASAPGLGRVVKIGANSLSFQAYPGSFGTDEFDYVIVDSRGGRATGTARIVVIPPGPTQPPLAVPDTMTVEPGRSVTLYPMANDFVAAGDRARIELIHPPLGVELSDTDGPVVAKTTGLKPGQTLDIVYRLTDGIDFTQATITIRVAAPYNNPPVVPDSFGALTDSAAVSVDVLKKAYDPDGPSQDLKVTDVYASDAKVRSGVITVLRGDSPRVVPFRVADADGGSATANLYVPASGGGLPFVKAGAIIRLQSGERRRVELADYVVNPSGGPVRLEPTGTVEASPAGRVTAAAAGRTGLTVSADNRFAGPGAVTFEVAAKGGRQRLVLSVPVQVGKTAPVLRCPGEVIDVAQGGQVSLDITSLCHVFTADPGDLAALSYQSQWREEVTGVELVDGSGRTLSVRATGAATAGDIAVLAVSAPGSKVALLRLRVVGAPPPTVSAMTVSGLRAGQSRTVDLAPYLIAAVPDPQPTVVQVSALAGGDVSVAKAGGTRIRITAGAKAKGQATFRVLMSDVTRADPRRQASNVLTVDLLGVPEVPNAPAPAGQVLSQTARLTWASPPNNGSPIDRYEVRASNGATQTCPTTACVIHGLSNGKAYTFEVRAHNAVGWSDFSARSKPVTPDGVPGAVRNFEVRKLADGAIGLTWSPPSTNGTNIIDYVLTWQGGSSHTHGDTVGDATGLDNHLKYNVTVVAVNAVGAGPPVTLKNLQSAGPVGQPDAPDLTAEDQGSTATLHVTWAAVAPSAPEATRYTVYRKRGAVIEKVPDCVGILVLNCDLAGIAYDGQTYQFSLEASNSYGGQISEGSNTWEAIADPLAWGPWSWDAKGTSGTVTTTFTVPDSRGDVSKVTAFVDGDPAWTDDSMRGTVTKQVLVGDNDRPHNVYFKVCNESARCSPSGVQAAQAYGGLSASLIDASPIVTDVTLVGWSIKVDPNGAPVDVTVTSKERPTQTFHIDAVDTRTVTVDAVDLGYETTETITVRLTDNNHFRGNPTKDFDYTTDPPPPPKVTVSRGSQCADGGANPCHPAGDGQADCTGTSCAFIVLDVANFFGPVTCNVTAVTDGPLGQVDVADNSTTQTDLYYGQPGTTIKAVCVANGLTATGKITW